MSRSIHIPELTTPSNNPPMNDQTARTASEMYLPQDGMSQTMQNINYPVMQGVPPSTTSKMGYQTMDVMQPTFPEVVPSFGRTAGSKKKSECTTRALYVVHNTSERRRMERLNAKIEELYSILTVWFVQRCDRIVDGSYDQ